MTAQSQYIDKQQYGTFKRPSTSLAICHLKTLCIPCNDGAWSPFSNQRVFLWLAAQHSYKLCSTTHQSWTYPSSTSLFTCTAHTERDQYFSDWLAIFYFCVYCTHRNRLIGLPTRNLIEWQAMWPLDWIPDWTQLHQKGPRDSNTLSNKSCSLHPFVQTHRNLGVFDEINYYSIKVKGLLETLVLSEVKKTDRTLLSLILKSPWSLSNKHTSVENWPSQVETDPFCWISNFNFYVYTCTLHTEQDRSFSNRMITNFSSTCNSTGTERTRSIVLRLELRIFPLFPSNHRKELWLEDQKEKEKSPLLLLSTPLRNNHHTVDQLHTVLR